ncbi:MAG: hypothetical protein ABEJ24_03785 [Candidatus Magasanikbacteria bacterium]
MIRKPDSNISRPESKEDKDQISEIISSIEKEGEKSPHLELDKEAKEALNELKEKLKQEDKDSLISVIRSYGKSKKDLRGLFDRLEDFKEDVPQLDGIFIPVNKEGDEEQNGETLKNVKELISENDFSFEVIPIGVENYSWTAGLNGPIAILNELAEREDIEKDHVKILNRSFDVKFPEDQRQEIEEKLQSGEQIVTIRDEDEDLQEGTIEDAVKQTKKLLSKGEQIGDIDKFLHEHELIASIARNTGMVFSLEDLVDLGGFDKHMNDVGGMEDQELAARGILKTLKDMQAEEDKPEDERSQERIERLFEKLTDIFASMDDPVVFEDQAWNSLDQSDRKDKLERELTAINTVVKEIQGKVEAGKSLKTPEENRDFRLE